MPKQHGVYGGHGNNIAPSLIEAAALAGFRLTVVSAAGYQPKAEVLQRARSISGEALRVELTSHLTGLDDATAIYTDVWASMGQESERDERRKAFAPYQVNESVMHAAPRPALFHCHPPHPLAQVTDHLIA